jgi:hypothetical protein
VRVARAGYPTRLPHRAFVQRYRMLLVDPDPLGQLPAVLQRAARGAPRGAAGMPLRRPSQSAGEVLQEAATSLLRVLVRALEADELQRQLQLRLRLPRAAAEASAKTSAADEAPPASPKRKGSCGVGVVAARQHDALQAAAVAVGLQLGLSKVFFRRRAYERCVLILYHQLMRCVLNHQSMRCVLIPSIDAVRSCTIN